MTRTFATALRLGLATLRLNPLSTSLSTLGIIMGAASLAAVLALGDGAEEFARQRIEREGLQVIRVASRMHDEVDGQRVPRASWVTNWHGRWPSRRYRAAGSAIACDCRASSERSSAS